MTAPTPTEPAWPPAPPQQDLAALLHTLKTIIDNLVWRTNGPHVAALAVIAQPHISNALAALDVLHHITQLHQPVRWAPDSPTVVCTGGCGAFPCPTAQLTWSINP
jgi:hypothetical protein